MNVNVNELKSWIGNEETIFDQVTKSLETRFRATLDIDPGNPENGEIASSGLHWALGPAVVKSSLLGKDSHPKKGDFLPPVPLPRRMWAGCRTHFFHSLKIGDQVKKISKVIIDEMSSVAESDQHSFSIPLTVDLNTGENWGTLH